MDITGSGFPPETRCGRCNGVISIIEGWKVLEGKCYHPLCAVMQRHAVGDLDGGLAGAMIAMMNMPEEELKKTLCMLLLDEKKNARHIAIPWVVAKLTKDDMIDLMVHLKKAVESGQSLEGEQADEKT